VKALTLRPHWAWFVVNGCKDIENRSWPTRLRGRNRRAKRADH